MRLLKVLPVLLALFVFTTVDAVAQERGSRSLTEEQKEEMRQKAEAYMAELNLSEEQKVEFEAINKKYKEEMTELRSSTADRRSKGKKMKDIQSRKNAEMKALLNADQYKVYEEKQKERKAAMKSRRKSRG